MTEKIHTCGIFIIDGMNRLLICKPVNKRKKKWTIPKGKQDFGELFIDTAIREVYEETSLNFKKYKHRLVAMGTMKKSNRVLHGFYLKIKKIIRANSLKCLCDFQEIEKYKMIKLTDNLDMIQCIQRKMLKRYLKKCKIN